MRTLAFALTASSTLALGALAACSGPAELPCCAGPDASTDGTSPAADAGPRPDGGAAPDARVAVQILAFNDFHGNLEPPGGSGGLVTVALDDPLVAALGADAGVTTNRDAGTATVPAGGAAYLAARVKALRAAQPQTLVVSAGDMIGASPFVSNLFRDEPAVLTMNALGLDFNGVGNHEFDRGLDELVRLTRGGCSLGDCDAGVAFAGARFQTLAANVRSDATNRTVFPPYAVRDVGGAKVGVIGLTLEGTPTVTVERAVAGLAFADEVETVNALVPRLRAEGASAIVLLVHQGGFQAATGTVDSCEGLSGEILPIVRALVTAVDVVVSAHTHQPYDCTVDGRLVTSAASAGRVLTKIDLEIDPAAGRVVRKAARNLVVTRDVAPDAEVLSILATYQARSAPLANRVVGHVTGDVTANAKTAASASCETPLGDVIADAQLDATKDAQTGGAVIAFMNPGGIRADLVHAAQGAEGAGAVTFGEAFAVQPFANNLVTMTLTGAQIRTLLAQQFATGQPRILQVSRGFAFAYTWNAGAKAGIIDAASVRLNGAPIADGTPYRVTVNAFLAGGGDGFAVLKAGADRLSGEVDLDAFVRYLGANDPLAPPTLGRASGDGCPLN